MVLIGNVPLFVLGWQYLGGPKFAFRTIVKIVAFSILTDTLVFFLPINGVTDDMVLNTVYGGLLLGVGLGIVYRGRGTSGGSDILGRILNRHFGITISQDVYKRQTLTSSMGPGIKIDHYDPSIA